MAQRVSSRRSVASGLACMVTGATALVWGLAGPAGATPQAAGNGACPGEADSAQYEEIDTDIVPVADDGPCDVAVQQESCAACAPPPPPPPPPCEPCPPPTTTPPPTAPPETTTTTAAPVPTTAVTPAEARPVHHRPEARELPKTGSNTTAPLAAAGAGLVVVGGTALVIGKRRLQRS